MKAMSRRSLIIKVSIAGIAAMILILYAVDRWHTRSVHSEEVVLSSPVSIPAVKQREGDPERGKDSLLSAAYISCGLPLRIAKTLMSNADEDRLPGRTGAAAELPYYNNLVTLPDGSEIVTNNCLTCHAARFNDELIIGLGNEFLDFTEDPSRSVERAGLLVRGDKETRIWRHLADRISAIAPYTMADTVGVNVANNLTFALMAHIDPISFTWSDEPLIDPPDTDPLPVSVPPWWRVAKKNGMFYQGQGRGDHARFMITAALLCVDGVDEVVAADEYAPDIRAYLESLKAPEYPFAIDAALAERGGAIFGQTCVQCHGNYGDTPTYPNLIIPLAIVGTDPALALQTADDNQRFNDWFERSYFGVDTDTVPARGYMAPPLDGVWATAPYLHNGSVPSIDVLLNSAARPAYWKHETEHVYDKAVLGWRYKELAAGKKPDDSVAVNRLIYDTTRRGYANTGHTFGDHLTDQERTAVLEYLKTL